MSSVEPPFAERPSSEPPPELSSSGWAPSDLTPTGSPPSELSSSELSSSGLVPAGDDALAGVSVVVTRATHQAAPLREGLTALGAEVVDAPAISLAEPSDGGAAFGKAVAAIRDGAYRWVVLTSANGADRLADAWAKLGSNPGSTASAGTDSGIAWPDGVSVASVGPATTAALTDAGIPVTLVAHEAVGESLVEAFAQLQPPTDGERVLVARAEAGRPTVPDGLAVLGWEVDLVAAYSVVPTQYPDSLLAQIAAAQVVTFASGRTAQFVVEQCGVDGLPPVVVCIGPVAARATEELGVPVAEVADPRTTKGLVAAVVRATHPRAAPEMSDL